MNRLHPATMVVAFLPKLFEAFRQVLPFLAVSLFTGRGDNSELFFAAIGILGGFGAITAYWTTQYGILDGHLVCTSGWLFKRDRRIPLDHIQNVNLKQGILERAFNVVTVEIETAASSGAELKLQVVTEDAANELRGQLAVPVASVESLTERDQRTYRISKQDLILGAMTENQGSQVLFALIGTVGVAALSQFFFRFFQFKELVPSWVIWSASILGILLVWGFGWVYGAIQYAVKYGRFTVAREPGLIRISHGILTKLQFAVRLRRVEIAIVSSTVWQRIVRRCTVRVGTAGTFGEEGATVPLALMIPADSADSAVQSVLPTFDESMLDWKPLPRYYMLSQATRVLLTSSLFAGISLGLYYTGFGRLLQGLGWLIPTLFGSYLFWLVAGVVFGYRKMAYAVSNEFIASRGGLFTKTVYYMPLAKVETIGTTEPPWWRRRQVTRLIATGMVQSIVLPMIPESAVAKIANLMLERNSKIAGTFIDADAGQASP
jgi:putative membrane protein